MSPKSLFTFRDIWPRNGRDPFAYCDPPFGCHYVATIKVATCLVFFYFFNWSCWLNSFRHGNYFDVSAELVLINNIGSLLISILWLRRTVTSVSNPFNSRQLLSSKSWNYYSLVMPAEAASGVKRHASVWRPSVCLSHVFLTLIGRAAWLTRGQHSMRSAYISVRVLRWRTYLITEQKRKGKETISLTSQRITILILGSSTFYFAVGRGC